MTTPMARRMTPDEADTAVRDDAARIRGDHRRRCAVCGTAGCTRVVYVQGGDVVCCECDGAGSYCPLGQHTR